MLSEGTDLWIRVTTEIYSIVLQQAQTRLERGQLFTA